MITVSIGKADASCPEKITLTSGMVKAVQVEFAFSEEWNDFNKIAVFSNSSTTLDVSLDETGRCYIPHEVLTKAGREVSVGVYGCKGEGDDYVAIPTVKCSLGKVVEGVNPTGEESAEPTPTVYDDLREEISKKADIHAGMKPISLIGITEFERELNELESLTENTIELSLPNTATINFQGYVDISIKEYGDNIALYVDGKWLDSDTSYNGIVTKNIQIVDTSGDRVYFERFYGLPVAYSEYYKIEEVDTKFENVDTKFEEVDTKFEEVDTKFEEVDTKFEEVDTKKVDIYPVMQNITLDAEVIRGDATIEGNVISHSQESISQIQVHYQGYVDFQATITEGDSGLNLCIDDATLKNYIKAENGVVRYTGFVKSSFIIRMSTVCKSITIDKFKGTAFPLADELNNKADKADIMALTDVDLTEVATITSGEGEITSSDIFGASSDSVCNFKIDLTGYVELDCFIDGYGGIASLSIEGTTYYNQRVTFNGELTKPITGCLSSMEGSEFKVYKFLAVGEATVRDIVSNLDIKNGEGDHSLQQTPKSTNWIAENPYVIEYFQNPTDSNKLIIGELDENGNVIVKTCVTGDYSALFAGYGQITNQQSIAAGRRNVILGAMGCAAGNENFICAQYGFGTGTKNAVFGNGGFVQGGNNVVRGVYGSAMGANCEASADGSHAQNLFCKASGYGSDAGGIYTVANSTAQFVRGKYNASVAGSLVIIGNGTSESDRKNAFYLTTGGNGWFAGDVTFTYKGTEYKASDLLSRIEALETQLTNLQTPEA